MAPDFGLNSHWSPTAVAVESHWSETKRIGFSQQALQVDLQSHWSRSCQPRERHITHGSARDRSSGRLTPFGTRGHNFPCQARIQPGFHGLSEDKCCSWRRSDAKFATKNSPRFGALAATALDPGTVSVSTTVSRGPSWPCCIAQQKASQSLPAPEIRSRTGLANTLEVLGLEVNS